MTTQPSSSGDAHRDVGFEVERQASAPSAVQNRQPREGILTDYDWIPICGGIVLAGAAYPIVLWLCISILWVAAYGSHFLAAGQPPDEFGFAQFVVSSFGVLFIGAFLGALWTAIVVAMSMWIVYLFAASLRLRGNIQTFGAVWGGLVGFLAVLPFALAPFFGEAPLWGAAGILALGPGLTTILGQLGGARGGMRSAKMAPAPAPAEAHAPDGAPLRFRIRHLLWITFWISLLMCAVRLSGIPFRYILPLLVGWLLYQAATLYIGSLLSAQWSRRRARSGTGVGPTP